MKISDHFVDEDFDNPVVQENGNKRVLDSDSDEEILFSITKKKKLQILDDNSDDDNETTNIASHSSNFIVANGTPVKNGGNESSDDDDLPLVKLHYPSENGSVSTASKATKLQVLDDSSDDDNETTNIASHSSNLSTVVNGTLVKNGKNESSDDDDDLPLVKLQHYPSETGRTSKAKPKASNNIINDEDSGLTSEDKPQVHVVSKQKKNTPKKPRKKNENIKKSLAKKPRASQKSKERDSTIKQQKNKDEDQSDDDDDDLPLIKLQVSVSENGNVTLPSPEKLLSFNDDDKFDSENFELTSQIELPTSQHKAKNAPKKQRKKNENVKEKAPKKPRVSKKSKMSDAAAECQSEAITFNGDIFDTEDSELMPSNLEASQLEKSIAKKPLKRKKDTKEKLPKKPRARRNKKTEVSDTQDEEPIHLNRDIFDADEPDQIGETTGIQEHLLDSEYLPENQKKSKPKKVKNKKEKKEGVSEKVREKEMFDIHSENQRLLRELSVKLPYRKAPKCSLDEFLKNRRKQSLPHHHDGELSLSEMPSTSACTNIDSYHCLEATKENNSAIEPTNSCDISYILNKDCVSKQSQTANGVESGINQISECVSTPETDKSAPDFISQSEINLGVDSEGDNFNEHAFDTKTEGSISGDTVVEKPNELKSIGDSKINILEEQTECVLNSKAEEHVSHMEMDVANLISDTEKHVHPKSVVDEENKGDAYLKSLENVSHNVPSEEPMQVEGNCVEKECNTVENDVANIEYEVKSSVAKLLDDVCESVPNIDDTTPTNFLSMKQKLLEAAKSFTPRISGEPDEVIDLGDGFIDFANGGIGSSHLHDSGLDQFVERFVSHTKEVSKKRTNQEVKLSIVSRDDGGDGELHLSEIYVDVSHNEEEETADKPGAKLLKLKERLFDKIMKKKEEELKKRKELEMMDNENQPDEEDEEEAELTDESDVDDIIEGGDVDDNADIDGDIDDDDDTEGEEEEFSLVRKKRKANPLIDDEASETNDSEISYSSNNRHSGIPNDDESISKDPDVVPESGANKDVPSEQSRLLYLESDSEDSFKDDASKLSGFEISSSAIPCYQPGGGFSHLNEQKSGEENHSELDDTMKSQASDMNDNMFPTDSQPEASQQLWPSQNPVPSPTWRTDLPELKASPDVCDLVTNPTQSQNNMDDLLALCSGNFTDSFKASSPKHSISPKDADDSLLNASNVSQDEKNIFEEPSQNCSLDESPKFSVQSSGLSVMDQSTGVSQTNVFAKPHPDPAKIAKDLHFNSTPPDVSDALEFCSGAFGSGPLSPDKETEDDPVQDNFDRINNSSLPVIERKRLRLLSDSDNDEVDGIDDGDVVHDGNNDEDEDRLSTDSHFSKDPYRIDPNDDIMKEELEGFEDVNKVSKVNDYFEDEAELSGSDVGSDVDADVDEDGYLEDLIHDDELYSEDDLRSQIGKVHLKKLMDEDKRQLRLYQELYLEDGDLHTEGPGRQRKFTWRNSGALDFVGGEEGASESEHEDAPEEEKWRLERHEREQWLREQEDKDDAPKISPVKFKSRSSLKLEIVNKVTETTPTTTNYSSASSGTVFSGSSTKMIRGSILARGQDYLSGLAKRLKRCGDNDTTGSRTTKHFVFRAISPKKEAETKPSSSQDKPSRPSTAKVLRSINVTSKTRKSVFDYLDTA